LLKGTATVSTATTTPTENTTAGAYLLQN